MTSEITRLAQAPLSPDIREVARRSLLNVLGTAIGASGHPTIDAILRVGQSHGGAGISPVPGRSELLDPLVAATATGTAAHIDDFDDIHPATLLHASAATMAAVLCLSAVRPVDGSAFLRAFTLGCEAQLRIAAAMSPEHYDDGWHITGTCAPLGAAIAAGLIVGLDESHLAKALGIAASQTIGTREAFGTVTKAFHSGKGAANGILAVLLVEEGFTGPMDVLENKRGLFEVLSPRGHRLAHVANGWGDRWELAANTLKPYPCATVAHPAIDAAISLSSRLKDVREINSVTAMVHPLAAQIASNLNPKTGVEAQFSLTHAIAAGLTDGHVGLRHYQDRRVLAEDLDHMRKLISYSVKSGQPLDAATIRVCLRDGTELIEHVEHARGSLARPMTDGELGEKFRDLVEPVLPGRSEAIIAAVNGLDTTFDSRKLVRVVQP